MGGNNKRKYGGHTRHNPKRGGPGILLTCETGREGKCKREGLEILQYYYDGNTNKPSEDQPKLSLDEEISMLQNDVSSLPFQKYETGCKGTVFLLHTPATHSDDKLSTTKKQKVAAATTETKQDEDPKKDSSKKECSQKQDLGTLDWDPLDLVRRVLEDLKTQSQEAPASRFVTRMIPIQKTCFATLEDVTDTVDSLIQSSKEPKTFGIVLKRRNCDRLTRNPIIDAVATRLTTKYQWKVQLTDPDYAIHIQICKTLCGISVIPKTYYDFQNFNLVRARTPPEADTTTATTTTTTTTT